MHVRMYLTQPTFTENLKIEFFAKKKVVSNKNGYNFYVQTRKNLCKIWKSIYAKSYIQFQPPKLFWIIFRFLKFKREIWKLEDFRFC
jgi:hypothetical protein